MRLIGDGLMMLPDGSIVPTDTPCTYEPGAGWMILYDERRSTMEPGTSPPAEPVAAPLPAAPVPTSEPVHAAPPATEHAAPSGEFDPVMQAGQVLQDNPWAPLVMVVLAVIAMFGGQRAWKHYADRSAQKHELEMRRLDIQAQQAGLQGAQPPPCQAKQVEVDRALADLTGRMQTLERKQGAMVGLDAESVEELEKRVKKLEKAKRPSTEA
ncbi:MAG: hypothetical protein KGS10_05560 [Chloroflexi bacterium]|nr:hypothetical protein [Chloroflexota bacterium]